LINFAIWITRATGLQASQAGLRGIAIAAGVFACFIHAISRSGGIYFSNLLALTKILILLFIIITAIIVASNGQVLKAADASFVPGNVFSDNMNADTAFKYASQDSHSYASAFLSISMTPPPNI
jgi:hypothetical protein